jgi:hypothetical protein
MRTAWCSSVRLASVTQTTEMFDVSKLTLDEVGEEIDRTIDKLSRLQALHSAMLRQDGNRIDRLVKEFYASRKKESDGASNSRV